MNHRQKNYRGTSPGACQRRCPLIRMPKKSRRKGRRERGSTKRTGRGYKNAKIKKPPEKVDTFPHLFFEIQLVNQRFTVSKHYKV